MNTTALKSSRTPRVTENHLTSSLIPFWNSSSGPPQKKSRNPAPYIKTLLTSIIIALVSQTANADEYRTWTEEATKRKIEAKIVDKDEKAGTVSLILKSLKSVKLDVSKLTEDDQKYVKGWSKSIRPEDQLTVRVVASGQSRGGKRVEVDVKASKSDLVVSGGCDAGCHRLRKEVKAGERELFQMEVHDKYTFTLHDADGNLLDQETALKKTGKTDSR